MDGAAAVQSTPQAVTGGVRLHYDLVGLSNGGHTVVVAACNEWACSTTVSFSFNKQTAPVTPTGIGTSPN